MRGRGGAGRCGMGTGRWLWKGAEWAIDLVPRTRSRCAAAAAAARAALSTLCWLHAIPSGGERERHVRATGEVGGDGEGVGLGGGSKRRVIGRVGVGRGRPWAGCGTRVYHTKRTRP